jgi:hypothetical protein
LAGLGGSGEVVRQGVELVCRGGIVTCWYSAGFDCCNCCRLLISWANGESLVLSEADAVPVVLVAAVLVFEPALCSELVRIDCRKPERLFMELLMSVLSAIALRF